MTSEVAFTPTLSGVMISKVCAFFSMPSWWMPLSCAKAFRPTIALLYCTGNADTAEMSLEARISIVLSTPVV